jgi:hypothetical protein
MRIKQIIQFLSIPLLLVMTQACESRKEPFKYYSFCEVLYYPCEGKDNCVGYSTYEGLAKDKGKCTYFKISSSLSPELDTDKREIVVFETIAAVYPNIQPKISLDTFKYLYNRFQIDRVTFTPFTEYIKHMDGRFGTKPPSYELYGMQVYSSKEETGVDVLIIPNTLDSFIKCSFETDEYYKDQTVCHVISDVDKTVRVFYSIPYGSVKQFKEINQAYLNTVRNFLLNTK